MAAPTTPVKLVKCFACFDGDPYKLFKGDGIKWKSHEMSQKLSSLVGDVTEYWGTLREKKMGFCPACFRKVLDMVLFLEQIKDNMGKISQQKTGQDTSREAKER